MTTTVTNVLRAELVLLANQNGIAVIPSPTPLTGLNYFDGKLLRADDMRAEQEYLRALVQLANRGGGAGIVNGFDTVLAGDGGAVSIGPGLAFDAMGRTLLLPVSKSLDLGALVAATANAVTGAAATADGSADFGDCTVSGGATSVDPTQTADLYLLTVGFLEALCGEEDVLGKLCQDACVTSKDRRYRVEGVVFRALPLSLGALPYASVKAISIEAKHLRSQVAAGYYASERARVASLVNGAGIRGGTWCLGAGAEIGGDVPLAVFSRSGDVTHFLDAWTARRERMETPPRRYWAWRMAMRPWDVFLAQILQFQCQLHDLLLGGPAGPGAGGGPCVDERRAISDASVLIGQLESYHATLADTVASLRAAGNAAADTITLFPAGLAAIAALKARLGGFAVAPRQDRILIDGGIVELPSAGYLPVLTGKTATVNDQVRSFMGPGVDLRFCIVTPDYVPHALEEAQHMDRISLLDGLDDPKKIPQVDVLVPNGQFVTRAQRDGSYYAVTVSEGEAAAVHGAGHSRPSSGDGGEFYFAGLVDKATFVGLSNFRANLASFLNVTPPVASATRARTADARATFDTNAWHALMSAPPAATAAANANAPATGALKEATPRTAEYAEATIAKNPFALAQNASTDLKLRMVNLVDPRVIDMVLTGTFTVGTPAADIGNGTESVTGWLTIQSTVSVGGKSGTPPASQVASVEIRRQIQGIGGSVEIRLVLAGKASTLTYAWQGPPLEGTLTGFDDAVKVNLTLDPTVADRTNAAHVLAESALDAIAVPLAQPSFRAAAEQNLFPPDGPNAPLDVIGTLDWVMFHRRRVRNCGEVKTVVDQRRYGVYAYSVSEFDVASVFERLIVSPDDVPKLHVRPNGVGTRVDTVSFTDGRLNRGDLAALDLGGALGTGATVLWAGIATDGAAPAPATQVDRLMQYEKAIASVADVPATSMPQVLDQVPPALKDAALDGAIILLTRPARQEVSAWRIDPKNVDLNLDAFVKGMQAPFDPSVVSPLGTVTWGATAPSDPAELKAVEDAWGTQGGGLARGAYVYYPAGDAAPASATSRAVALEKALGGDGSGAVVMEGAETMPGGEALAVLLVPTVNITVYFVTNADSFTSFTAQKITETRVPKLLALCKPLGTFDLDLKEGAIVESDTFVAAWKKATGANAPDRVHVFPCWADDAAVGGSDLAGRRTDVVLAALTALGVGHQKSKLITAAAGLSLLKDSPMVLFVG